MYSCSFGCDCPFDDVDFWYFGVTAGSAGIIAHDNCPLQKYEDSNHVSADGVRVLSDICKHLTLTLDDEDAD